MFIPASSIFQYTTTHTNIHPLVGLDGGDATVLQAVKELNFRRNMACMKECLLIGGGAATDDSNAALTTLADWMCKYISLLDAFINKLAAVVGSMDVAEPKGFLWSSPLCQLSHGARFSLGSVLLERIMTLLMYASILQQQAQSICSTIFDSSATNSSDTADILPAAVLFRKAAGIHNYIKMNLLPHALKDIPVDAPCELCSEALTTLEAICLAQAQAVAAQRAEDKGTSPSTVAAVHMGAVSLFESAAASSSKLPGPRQVSETFKRWLAVSSGIHRAKALRALAAVCRKDDLELGKAVGCLHAASKQVQQCIVIASDIKQTEWLPALKQEQEQLQQFLELCDKERMQVYYQTIAVPPVLPEGKVIVKLEEYNNASHDAGESSHYFML